MSINITKCTSTNNTTACNRTPKYIVIHYTAGTSSSPGSAKSNAKYFSNSFAKASADFFVDDSEIIQFNPDPTKYYCWSVGGTKYKSMSTSEGGKLYGIAKNSNCVNIEMCSNKTNKSTLNATDTDWYITDSTLNNAVELTKYLMSLYNIPISNVIMHHHVTGKICPNPFCVNESALSKWESFKNKVSNSVDSNNPIENNKVPQQTKYYRVRKTWEDASSQIGAFTSLNNAKAACQNGYSVFDDNGNKVYTNNPNPESISSNTIINNPSINTDSKLKLNSDTKSIQSWLNTYYKTGLVVDGVYGKNTKAAIIKAWQTEVGGLSVDGVFGIKSKSAASSHVIKNGSTGILVTIWQVYLVCRGYNPNGIDGTFGSGCKTATIAFQKSNGLSQDGIVGVNTWYKAFS